MMRDFDMKSSNLEMKIAFALSITLIAGLSLVSRAQGPNNSQSKGVHCTIPKAFFVNYGPGRS